MYTAAALWLLIKRYLDFDPSLSTVDILGGVIGDSTGVSLEYGGNVFGSSRGEIAAKGHQFDQLATVKESVVNIGKKNGTILSGDGLVMASVYGSGENGHVTTNATVNVYSGRVGNTNDSTSMANEYCGNVYGAGSGTDTYKEGTLDKYNPIAGIVKGNTEINIKGDWVMRSVYGGGEMASVGNFIDSLTVMHDDTLHSLAMSWPYEFVYDSVNHIPTGKATINVTGGRIGIPGKDADMDNGDIYGGAKGKGGETYEMAHLANVRETEININYDNLNVTPANYKKAANTNAEHGCITGAVYGGSENGHVNGNTHVTLTKGLIGHAIYGGGKGKGKYNGNYVLTAGKVYGNTYIDVNAANNTDAYVVRSVFGGGNLASVGKGNYVGYGEMDNDSNWNDTLNSGHTYITITGGTLGMLDTVNPDKVFKDNIPYGSVFGGCRGNVVADTVDRFGYVGHTHVVIGTEGATTGPRLYGSVYGGAQDGHVRWGTNTTVYSGEIGVQFGGSEHVSMYDSINSNPNSIYWVARGNVFGSGSGLGQYEAYKPNSTNPQVNDTVMEYNPNAGSVNCNTKVVVNGGNVRRDVFGGGNRASVGIIFDSIPHPQSEMAEGHTRVHINGGTVGGNVYGGGNMSFVEKERVVNINGGTVEGDVFAGSNNGLADTAFVSLKTVNVRGGHIMGNVFGGSNNADEGDNSRVWTAFVNITGGQIDNNVYAAGKGGSVDGSLCVNIGSNAILNAPTHQIPVNPSSPNVNAYYNDSEDGTPIEPTPARLVIGGSLFGGSHHVGNDLSDHWNTFDITGASAMFIDGTDYNTLSDVDHDTISGLPVMNIGGGVYGSGEHCESGAAGREIIIREYGHRDSDNELTHASRTLTTIQRGGIVLLERANLNLSGAKDISKQDTATNYGVLKVDMSMFVSNGGGIVLGALGKPAYMDSIKQVRSLYLNDTLSSYNMMGAGNNDRWEVIGIKDNINPKLYRIHGDSTLTELSRADENVIIFNDSSVLWVRYHDKKTGDTESKQYYGELQGFFRMRGDSYQPYDTISFAYARPKITDGTQEDDNVADGGFLSYNNDYNYFIDFGAALTKTEQYPYINVLDFSKGDRTDYRMWVDLPRGNRWYVDGTRNWGQDILKSVDIQSGRFPDKPKKTLFGSVTENGSPKGSGIISEAFPNDLYSYKNDYIYVVGALSAQDEAVLVRDTILTENEVATRYPLKLYRYPGGHPMSNDSIDFGGGKTPVWGVAAGTHAGPGANYGAMLNVQANKEIKLRGVEMDGLYGFNNYDKERHMIPTDYPEEADSINFHQYDVNMPLVVTHDYSTLTLCDSTVLKRGFNNIWADTTWYFDADYAGVYPAGDSVYHGAALYVNKDATVNVGGMVTITDNWQLRRKTDTEYVTTLSNVYLPSFHTHLYMDSLALNTKIGVTSPIRNTHVNYAYNTLSPVAEGIRGGNDANNQPHSRIDAEAAWQRCNFLDDQEWFFVNGHNPMYDSTNRTTYYGGDDNFNKLYFGWTWANAIRKQPAGYSESGNDISISSEEGLAWLISVVNGMNEQPVNNLTGKTVSLVTASSGQIYDIYDLQQYIWVPIGDSIPGKNYRPFAGTFEGNGHIITNLTIGYLGKGDKRYERNNYGMFGYVKNGTINRTFLLNSVIKPVGTVDIGQASPANVYNIGGLVGCIDGSTLISNSEAAVDIYCTDKSKYEVVAGGLVGEMKAGEIHSSMAMPTMKAGVLTQGPVGGLVGCAANGEINNSFANAEFNFKHSNDTVAGGLMGVNNGATMRNCYVALQPGCDSLTRTNFGSIVNHFDAGDIDNCYVMTNDTAFNFSVTIGNTLSFGEHCGQYAPVITADELGYMYADNRVFYISQTANGADTTVYDTTLFMVLNRWSYANNKANHDSTYAHWARPGLSEINADLPVLLLSEYDNNYAPQGDFRSVGTYAGGPALQYGGPVRDRVEVDSALVRQRAIANNKDYLFIYGDVNGISGNLEITQKKVSIYEHAAILSAGSLASYDSTYVGITFDNSRRHALSTAGVNGLGMQDLPRDWHMFSTPLSKAPLGFNYDLEDGTNTNINTYTAGNQGLYYNNPWFDPNPSKEFHWLNGGNAGNKRYWMKGWANSQITGQEFNETKWADGYFPSSLSSLHTFGEGCIANSDEDGRYPYGMDFFTWYEPEYHWVNFKRNGPNHWHSDEPHQHLDYYGSAKNVNEEALIKGRGYMAAISVPTFLQSHGMLNTSTQSIPLTKEGENCNGWNLVGNPFHAYLDFEAFVNNQANNVLDSITVGDNTKYPFYVVYNADGYGDEGNYAPESAFVCYVHGGSEGGAYASRYLHPHQAFFVMASNEDTLQFTDGVGGGSMVVPRSDTTYSPFREYRPNYPLVNLFLSSDNGCQDVTVVEFERPAWGGATKLRELRCGNGLFYGYHDHEHYAALFAKAGATRVPLWFEAKEDDIFTIKWNTANADFSSLYLIDNLKGVEYDMLANDAYTFEGHKDDYYSRFYIVFNLTDVEEHHIEHSFAFFDGSQWVVTGEGELDFIDLQGRILWHGELSGGQSRLNFPIVAKGMYMLRLVNSNETKVQKIIVE